MRKFAKNIAFLMKKCVFSHILQKFALSLVCCAPRKNLRDFAAAQNRNFSRGVYSVPPRTERTGSGLCTMHQVAPGLACAYRCTGILQAAAGWSPSKFSDLLLCSNQIKLLL